MSSTSKKAGLICYHFIPAAFLFFSIEDISFQNLILFSLLLMGFYSLYEIGYIYNDTETTKREIEPTLRLAHEDSTYYENNKIAIYTLRLIFFLMIALFCISSNKSKRIDLYFVACIVELIVFLIYNNVRGRWSIPVFFLLETGKYLPFSVCHPQHMDWRLMIVIMAIYAIPNTIERLSFPRYKLKIMMNLFPVRESYLKFRGG